MKKQKNLMRADEIYKKFLFPSYRKSEKFRNKITTFSVILHSQNSEIVAKIDKYSEKFVNLLENILMENLMFNRQCEILIGMPKNKQYCENRHMVLLHKLDISEDDSSLSDLEDEILKTCLVSQSSGNESRVNGRLNMPKMPKLQTKSIFEITKEKKISSTNEIQTGKVLTPNLNAEPKIQNTIQHFGMDVEEEGKNRDTISNRDKNIPITGTITSTSTSTSTKEASSPSETLQPITNKEEQVNFPNIQNFTKFVDFAQESKEYQPLVCLSKEIGIETSHNSRKTSLHHTDMDVDMNCDQELETKNGKFVNNNVNNVNNISPRHSDSTTFKPPKTLKSYKIEIDPINEPYSNFNSYNKPYIPKMKSKEKLKNFIPFLKEFKPKFLKKENIDKKILRKFRNYVKSVYKVDSRTLDLYDKIFWRDFTTLNLLPPMKYQEHHTRIEFKSFNTKYLLWLFSKEGCVKLYEDFANKYSEQILQDFIVSYDLMNNKSEEGIIEQLKYYINAIPEIYSKRSNLIENSTHDNFSESHFTFNNGSKINSEDLLASYLGADFNLNTFSTFNLKNFGETTYSRCGLESLKKCQEEYDSYYNFADESFDSIPSVE